MHVVSHTVSLIEALYLHLFHHLRISRELQILLGPYSSSDVSCLQCLAFARITISKPQW